MFLGRIRHPSKDGAPLFALGSRHFLSFFGRLVKFLDDGISLELVVGETFEEGVIFEVRDHPLVQVVNVSDGVDQTDFLLQDVGVFGQKGLKA